MTAITCTLALASLAFIAAGIREHRVARELQRAWQARTSGHRACRDRQ